MSNNATEKEEQDLKPARRQRVSGRSGKAWHLIEKLQGVIGLIVIIIAAIVLSPRARDGSLIFIEIGNLTDILRQVSEIGIIALGMTFVILTAGIDLSVGSVLAISASITAKMLTRVGDSWAYFPHIALAVGAALLATAVLGLLNGVVIAKLRIQPFIVTLASMMGVRGVARELTSNTNIDFSFSGDVTSAFTDVMSQKSVVVGSFVGLAFVLAFLLKRTVFGRYVRATGDNEKAARYAGIPIERTTILVYLICGLCSGFAGVLHAAQCHQGNPNDGVAYELDAIAAVVIGGTSLVGGEGTIVGTIIGTLIMGILTNILRLKMVDSNYELMIKAVIIVLAVWAQSRKRVV